MVPQTGEIGIVLHPVIVVIAEFDGAFQRLQGLRLPAYEGEAARQVVVGRCVVGLEADEFAVHLQTLRDPSLLGVESAEDLDDVRETGVAFEDGLEEAGFELDVVRGLGHGADSGGVVGATAAIR